MRENPRGQAQLEVSDLLLLFGRAQRRQSWDTVVQPGRSLSLSEAKECRRHREFAGRSPTSRHVAPKKRSPLSILKCRLVSALYPSG